MSRARALLMKAALVAHRGFEPLISALRGRCPGPLDECAAPIRIPARRPLGQLHAPLALVVLFGLAAASACSDDGTGDGPRPLTPELEQVMRQVAEIRGLPPAGDIRAGTVSARDLPDRLEAALTDDDRAAFERLTTLYRLLGHLPADSNYLSVYREFAGNRIAGFYSPADKVFYVNSTAESVNFGEFETWQRSTTAHEFVHALQDAEFDLGSFAERTKDDLDWSLALSAVIEGDAVVHERLWAQDHLLAPAVPGRPTSLGRMPFTSVPVSIEREFVFPYTSGLDWVATVRTQRGIEAINGVLRGRRITTAEILHPELYDSGWQPREVALPDLARDLGDGWQADSSGAFGEFHLRNLLQMHLGGLESVSGAAGWAGDRYAVYRHGAESVAVIRVAFADEREREQFLTLFRDWLEAADGLETVGAAVGTTFEDGRTIRAAALGAMDVLLVFGSDGDTADRAFTLLAGG